jgi:hypothetical protein
MSENASKLSDNDFPKKGGGEGGIRTLDTLTGMPHFECGAVSLTPTRLQFVPVPDCVETGTESCV